MGGVSRQPIGLVNNGVSVGSNMGFPGNFNASLGAPAVSPGYAPMNSLGGSSFDSAGN
jgi:hypothetical protein